MQILYKNLGKEESISLNGGKNWKKKIGGKKNMKKYMNNKIKLVIAIGISTLFIVTTMASAKPTGADNDWNYWTNPPNMFSNVTGNVGIGTTTPVAKFQVQNGTVYFNGNTGGTPTSGAGTRLMWIPSKKAFRAGSVTGTQWNNANIGLNSVAMGHSTKANATASTAIGWFTTASGNDSTAIGWFTTASGIASITMGCFTTASGVDSTAMGWATTGSGIDSTAMGDDTTASGTDSTAMGRATTASGDVSTAMGWFTTASGNDSTAMGHLTIAKGQYATAMGESTTANGDFSTAIGTSITTNGSYSTGIGLDWYPPGWVVKSSHVMSIMGGNVGIGTTNPKSALQVNGAITLNPMTAPPTPTTGFILYCDQVDGKLKAKSSSGTVTVLANP